MKDTSKRTLSVIMSLCVVIAMYRGALIFNNSQELTYSNSSDEETLKDKAPYKYRNIYKRTRRKNNN